MAGKTNEALETDGKERDFGQAEPAEEAPETADIEVAPEDIARPPSRRERARQEKEALAAEVKASRERAEAAEKLARELSDQFGRFREELPRQMGEQFRQFVPQQQMPPQRQEQGPSLDARVAELRKRVKQSLLDSKMDDYHEAVEELADLKAQARMQEVVRSIPRPQQTFEKPPWVSAVESQYPDVLMHPMGVRLVTQFAPVHEMMGKNQMEALRAGFDEARQRLGTGQQQKPKEEAGTATVDRQAIMGNARASGVSGGAGARANPSGKVKVRGLPANYKDIAKAAGMSPEKYVRRFVEANPDSVEK